MKVTREELKKEFIPVVVTLETQEEVDGLYAFLNNGLSDAVGLDSQYHALCPHTKNWLPLHEDLNEAARRFGQ